jgi:DNA invertase Pin-like site-specific DNA recombinase
MSRTFVTYLRVSTDKQGRSGLGLEAQQAAIAAYVRPDDMLLAPPYVEIESGKRADRPQLRAALDHCRRTGATLLIARLDRLARNVAFIANLIEQGVPFVACDRPNASTFELHIYASMAQEEARAISARTKAALAAAKARGTVLGGDRGYRAGKPPPAAEGAAGARLKADQAAHRAHAAIAAIRAAEGASASLAALARGLTARGVASPRGGTWTATAVRRVLARVAG